MPKNKRPVPRKAAQQAAAPDEDALAQAMADLALDLAVPEDGDAATLRQKEEELDRMVHNALRKKNDELLYDAIERARFSDVPAYELLRSKVEEASGTVVMRRPDAPAMEINAFAIPLFVHTEGGLNEAEGFNDAQAFDELSASFSQAGLESPDAKVVLVAHAYDPDEAGRITYCQLNDMVRDCHASLTGKKLVATPALEASIRGWAPRQIGPADATVELRFLLGFALKRADDPFYAVPQDEAAAEAWFDARMERYRDWTASAAPLVRRLLGARPDAIEVNFLYQDLYFGALRQGFGELETLEMMTQLNQALDRAGIAPDQASARVEPVADGDALLLRVTLFGPGGTTLATVDKPLDVDEDLGAEVEDVRDALGAIRVSLVDGGTGGASAAT